MMSAYTMKPTICIVKNQFLAWLTLNSNYLATCSKFSFAYRPMAAIYKSMITKIVCME